MSSPTHKPVRTVKIDCPLIKRKISNDSSYHMQQSSVKKSSPPNERYKSPRPFLDEEQ